MISKLELKETINGWFVEKLSSHAYISEDKKILFILDDDKTVLYSVQVHKDFNELAVFDCINNCEYKQEKY